MAHYDIVVCNVGISYRSRLVSVTSDIIPQTIKEGQALETTADPPSTEGEVGEGGAKSLSDIAISAKFIGKVAVATSGAGGGGGSSSSRRDSTVSSKMGDRKTSTESEVSAVATSSDQQPQPTTSE